MATITVRPVEVDGAHWVVTDMDDRETKYGPYPNLDEAEAKATAVRVAACCRGLLHQPVHIGPAKRRP